MRLDLTAIMVRLFAALMTLTFAFAGFGTQLDDKDGISARATYVVSGDLVPSGATPPLPGSLLSWGLVATDSPSSRENTPFTHRDSFCPRTIFRDAPKRPPPHPPVLRQQLKTS